MKTSIRSLVLASVVAMASFPVLASDIEKIASNSMFEIKMEEMAQRPPAKDCCAKARQNAETCPHHKEGEAPCPRKPASVADADSAGYQSADLQRRCPDKPDHC